MQILMAVLSPVSAIVGVMIGGFITSRIQAQTHARAVADKRLTDRRDACAEFLGAVRTFRRYIMYSDLQFQIVSATAEAKGAVLAEGRAEHDARVDATLSRVMIVAGSDTIVQAAFELAKDLNDFIRLRAEHGRGRIPNSDVARLRAAEQDFAKKVVSELGLT
ncbi:hypothetical protein [Nocardia abscessus]|uniref:hypothetical protein n=1 Tax=Nocardia abscessus TaxID=120957 RepID=UPI0024546ACA|nr:hypothetical protein [Nocardia abscessus]